MRRVVNFVFIIVFALVLTACGGGGGSSGSPIDPTTTLNGIAVDNYIKGATVCIDTDKDNDCSDESSSNRTTTLPDGTFSFSNVTPTDDMVIIAYGGTDAITGENFDYIIKNIATNKDSNNKVVLSSLNTLITDYKFETNSTIAQSQVAVQNFISSNSLQNTIGDIMQNKSSTEFLKSLKIFQMVAAINDTNNSTESAKSFKAIAKAIASDSSLRDTNSSITVTRESISKTISDTIYKPVFLRADSSKEYLIYTNQATSSNSFNFFEAYDPKGLGLSYSLVNNTKDYDDFNISSTTGELSFKNPPSSITNPTDADGNGSYEVDVNISNGLNYIIKEVSIKVKTSYSGTTIQVPTFTAGPINISIDNNHSVNSSIYQITADPEGDTAIIKYESNSTLDSYFDINRTTGNIFVRKSLPLDANLSTAFRETLSITAINSAGRSLPINLIVDIYKSTDLNSTAIIDSNSSFGIVYENNNSAQVIGKVNVLSTGGNPISNYRISDGNFTISSDGNISTKVNNPFDYEDKQSYTFTVEANNSKGWGLPATIIVNIADVNEAPTIVSNQADYNISFGLDERFYFAVTDGDDVVQNLTISSSYSNDTNIATIVSNSINGDSSLATFVINGKNPGTARISFTIQDDGGTNVGIGDVNTTNHYFDVTVRANGWKIYEDQKAALASENSIDSVDFDDINYTWNSANRWYENNTSGTILMPVKVLATKDKSANMEPQVAKDGHYYVSKSNYINAGRKVEGAQHTINVTPYTSAVSGIDINASSDNFQHDPVHHLFVSKVVKKVAENGGAIVDNISSYTTFVGDTNSSGFAVAEDKNTTYNTDINMSSYMQPNESIDKNNNGNDYCANIYGVGWRLPTAYETGVNTASEGLRGYIPAYMGSTINAIWTSTKYDHDNNWMIYLSTGGTTYIPKNNNSNAIRCVYGIF